MLASAIKSDILRALSGGPKDLRELGRDLGSPIRLPGRDSDMVARLTPSGREMLFVTASLERWLERSPNGPLPFGGDGATEAIEALAKSWSSTALHILAERPRTLTELDRSVDVVGYSSAERCLEAMRLAGQLEMQPGRDGRAVYAITDWVREGIGPLAAAARLERRHRPYDAPAVATLDVEAAFRLVLPLLRVPRDLTGACRLAIEMTGGEVARLAGVVAHVEAGQIVSCTTTLEDSAGAWVTGDLRGWFHAVIDGNAEGLECGGDERLGSALVDGLHETLFGVASSY